MGLETLFELYKDTAKSHLHELYILVHSVFLERKLKCIGKKYDSKLPADQLKLSELLPSGWNDDDNSIELFYTADSVTVFKAVALTEGSSCLLHLISAAHGEDKSAFVEVSVIDYITETTQKTVDKVYRDVDRFKSLIIKNLINNVIPPPAEEKVASSSSKDEQRQQPFGRLYDPRGLDQEGQNRVFDPLRDYGRADVDPFFVGSGSVTPPPGGMVFDPFRQVRPRAPDRFAGLIEPLPRGSVPPGARFDPIGPPGTGMPDPDMERRPNFNDDFYS